MRKQRDERGEADRRTDPDEEFLPAPLAEFLPPGQ
jgi:hypothetical protein